MPEDSSVAKTNIGAKISSVITDAFCIALLTFSTYAGSYVYKLAYFQYFGIPAYLVEININDVLAIACFTLLYLISVISITDSVSNFLKPNSSRSARRLLLFILLVFVIFTPIIFSLYDPIHPDRSILFLCLAAAFFVAFFFVVATEDKLKENGTTEKDSNESRGLLNLVEKELGMYPIMTFFFLIMFIGDCSLIGTTFARDTQYFLVSKSEPNVALISKTENSFIGVTFNPDTHIFQRQIVLIDHISSDGKSETFSLMKLGHLYNPEKIHPF